MKKELTPIEKLMKRKQRMYMIQPVHAVVLHKRYFSNQSKRLRGFHEIAHGFNIFYGGVDRLAKQLENSQVDSEDDEFWDKRDLIMSAVYQLRVRALESCYKLSDDERAEVKMLVSSLVTPILVLPNGDVVQICERTNPSGSDATTENNCICRKLIENYVRILHRESLGLFDHNHLKCVPGTKFVGDDRIAAMKNYEPGFSDYYRENVGRTGVRIKTLVSTNGPIGAEFIGFKFAKAHWGSGYMPLFNLDRLIAGLFIPKDKDLSIGFTRLMSFSLLLYPHYEVFSKLRPIVVRYCQRFSHEPLADICAAWWSDEVFLKFMWTGQECQALFSPVRFEMSDYRLDFERCCVFLAEEGYLNRNGC